MRKDKVQDIHDRGTTTNLEEHELNISSHRESGAITPLVTDWSTFTDGDTTPDISTSSYWKTANTSEIVITNFDSPKDNIHKITILFTDANTTIQNNTNIVIHANEDFAGAVDDMKVFHWDGTNWVEQSVVAPASLIGVDYFLHDSDVSDIGGYDKLKKTPADHSETTHVTNVSASDGDVAIEEFITDVGDPDVLAILAGIWEFHIHADVSSTAGTTNLKVELYTRTAGGVETLIFSTEQEIDSTSAVELKWSYTQTTDTTTNLTDRLVVKLLCNATSVPQKTVTTYYEGSERSAHIHAPVDVGITAGAGAVLRLVATGNIFGDDTAVSNFAGPSNNSTVIGTNAFDDYVGDADGGLHSIYGRQAGRDYLGTGDGNMSLFGYSCGLKIVDGEYDAFFGTFAASSGTSTGGYNAGIGDSVLVKLDGASSQDNAGLGSFAGSKFQVGSDNLFAGSTAGPSTLSSFSDRIYIDTLAGDPLIGGDANNRRVGINTAFALTYILEVEQGSATDPRADAWDVYSLSMHKDDLGSPSSVLDKLRAMPLHQFKRKAQASEGGVLREAGKRLEREMKTAGYKRREAELMEIETAIDLDPIREKIIKEKVESKKFQVNQIGVFADDPDIPEEILSYDPDGTPTGLSLGGTVGFLLAAIQELTSEIDALRSP